MVDNKKAATIGIKMKKQTKSNVITTALFVFIILAVGMVGTPFYQDEIDYHESLKDISRVNFLTGARQ